MSKRPSEQQPGVVDQFANAIVRQLNAERIVVAKDAEYRCGPVRIPWRAVAADQRGYILGYKTNRVIFSSAKQAANALVRTLIDEGKKSFRHEVDECVYLKGAGALAILHVRIPSDEPQCGECTAKAVAAIEQLLTSNGVHLVKA
jgi:hypothetical protein